MGYKIMYAVVGGISRDGDGVGTIAMGCFHLFEKGFAYKHSP